MSKVLNVLVAAVGGFVAGILLAPKSGKETRQDLMDKKEEYLEKAKTGLHEAHRGASEVKREVTQAANAVKGTVRDTANKVNRSAQ